MSILTISHGIALAALSLTLNACVAQKHYLLRSGADAATTDEAAQIRVAQDEEQYGALFAAVTSAQLPAPTPPAVDFATDLVLFLSMGQKPTAGYTLKVDCVTCSADVLKVKVIPTAPPAGALKAQMITNPYVIVSTKKCPSAKEIVVTGLTKELRQPLPRPGKP